MGYEPAYTLNLAFVAKLTLLLLPSDIN